MEVEGDNFSGETNVNPALIEKLKSYIQQVCGILVYDLTVQDLQKNLNDCFNASESLENLHKFAGNSDCSNIIIYNSSDEIKIGFDIKSNESAVIKPYFSLIKNHESPLDLSKPLPLQLQFVSLTVDNVENISQEGIEGNYLQNMQQLTRHLLAPLVKSFKKHENESINEEDDHFVILQNRVRELDMALEQCQRGSIIPSISLPIPQILIEKSHSTDPIELRNMLQRYNISQIDLYFNQIGLTSVMGDTEAKREEFANAVNKTAKVWPTEITKLIKLIDSQFSGSIDKEINFWKDLDKKLTETKEQLESSSLLLTKLVLKRTNRVSEQLIQESENNLDKCLITVNESVKFLRDFPIKDLQSTNSLAKLSRCITNCINHFSKLKHSSYDFHRALRLLEVLGNIIVQKLMNIFREKNVLYCSIEDLTIVNNQYEEIIREAKQHLISIKGNLKDIGKKRNQSVPNLRFDFDLLERRIHSVVTFRQQHEKMHVILSTVLGGQDNELLSELKDAYKLIVLIKDDLYDLSPNGNNIWSSALQSYEKKLEKIETKITKILDEKLSTAKTTDEMFHIFSLFNPLFYRPAIRSAVNSFRTILMKSVREDVDRLKSKFKFRYDESHERVTSQLRDIPPLSGRIIWARQIENQLNFLMKRIQDVLGSGWEDHLEGKQLKEVCDELKNYLDTHQIYDEWLKKQLQKTETHDYYKFKEILLLVEEDSRTGNKLLKVNFDETQITVFKELKYLDWLLPSMKVANKNIPKSIVDRANLAFKRHPISLAIESAFSNYLTAKSKINSTNSALLVSHLKEVRDVIKEAFGGSKRIKWIKWDSKDLEEWVNLLVSKVYVLQERVDDVNTKIKSIDKFINDLTSCEYDVVKLEALIQQIQNVVDELPMKGLSNVPMWVNQLDLKMESVICKKLQNAVIAWCEAFVLDHRSARDNMNNEKFIEKSQNNQNEITPQKLERIFDIVSPSHQERLSSNQSIVLEPVSHEIVLSNQILFVQPSIEETKKYWIAEYHRFLSIACSLPRLVSQKFQVFAETTAVKQNYSNILGKISIDILKRPYTIIEAKLSQAIDYAHRWLQYQTLWDASISHVTDLLGNDLALWQKFLNDMKISRMDIDMNEDQKAFGPIVINHRQVQLKINLKYDNWQKESQNRFGQLLLNEIKSTHVELVGIKSKLETISFEGNTKDAILGVEFILKTKERVSFFETKVINLKSSEKLLQTQRFTFPSDWLPVSNISGVYSDMCNILDRRLNTMNSQLPFLQQKIKEEDMLITSRTQKFLENWNLQKPVEGHLVPSTALETISMYAGQLVKLIEDTQRLRGAKESLHLDYVSDDSLSFIELEINDLKEAWSAVLPVSDKIQVLFSTLIKDLNISNLRKQLDELISTIKNVSSKVRGYAAIEFTLERLNKYFNFQPILRDLSSESLKERHWKLLLDKLGIKQPLKFLSIGHIWESAALQQRKIIQEILSTAQGEQALEQFLKDLRDHWISRELILIFRENIKIVTGWENLFTTLEDHLTSLASLKQSPYFRNVPEFQEDAANWEMRLTNLRSIFEIWIEVQRKWIYLRGIFNNVDIKAQLPAQYSKFKSIDGEYTTLMKRISAKPVVLDILQIDNLNRQLEREDSTMTMIQKALGEYLERQRQIFPRFYFVNNEDLIEIIGNSNEPSKILLHLSKMFAAISSLQIINHEDNTNGGLATAILSKEGESVKLLSPVDISVGVKEWLSGLLNQMILSLGASLSSSLTELVSHTKDTSSENLLSWMNSFPAQVVVLASQIFWTKLVEEAFLSATQSKSSDNVLSSVQALLDSRLTTLSLSVLEEMSPDLRRKCEHLLTEMVHQRDVVRLLSNQQINSRDDFGWLYHLRFYWNNVNSSTANETESLLSRLSIQMSNASFNYGFEYLGVGERLVQTPLTDRCYLTLTQALHFRMGANPFGPAGTGKTESVKMLGSQLGRFVLVFNCDSSFDYAAMGRIFSGLCQVGAWGCFDEFNRLEERILSAVSQQILTIQKGLMSNLEQIDLLGNPCKLHKDVGIFVTLNPGYAGRSNLPDNLKQLFRAVAMSVPDRKLIAQVMLFSQGIASAEDLAGKIVLLFILCEEQLSQQSHYDFGLRALKSVLVGAGGLKRQYLLESAKHSDEEKSNLEELEKHVLIKSTCDSIVPKLVAEDIPVFINLLSAVFPGSNIPSSNNQPLLEAVKQICLDDCFELDEKWLQKILQLKQIQEIRHGIMLVGPSGSGKTSTWRTLLKALSKLDGTKADFFVIDPKSIKKEKLFGSLDPNTLEWTDGIFTKVLRRLNDTTSVRGVRRTWIVFDGDVDPEWAENLNSVLDDNKILTLPSGDRLKIPDNVRIIMEVDNLKYATLATVSRCGMVWFADSTLNLENIFRRQLGLLIKESTASLDNMTSSSSMKIHEDAIQKFVDNLKHSFLGQSPSFVEIVLNFSLQAPHIMTTSIGGLLDSLFSMISRGVNLLIEYNEANIDFPMNDAHIESFSLKWLLYSMVWSFGSSLPESGRKSLSNIIEQNSTISLPHKLTLFDLQPNVQDGEWIECSSLVPRMEIESHRVSSSDIVVPTIDTVRHTEVLKCWLLARKPVILCGPPGSGKTMTLTSVIETIPEFILAPLNFSSGTTPELLLKTFAQYCEVVDSPDGLVLQPNRQSYRDNQWLVVFCDEINLPACDSYGTQRVIMFMRQLTEQGGYWNADCKWVHLKRIQFIGACNPPTDAGRVDLSLRFLRQATVILVDYPSEVSLKQIYRCFNQALLRMHPSLKGFTDPMNDAMVDLYLKNKDKFTADMAPQYIYSPRELSRWVRAMYEAMEPLEAMTAEELVRLWGHEGLRLFQDRLIDSEDKEWCIRMIENVASRHFPGVDVGECLKRPILYSQWIKRTYQSTDREILRDFVAARLRIFYEEELDVPLVIFDEVLDHVLRIDNVLRHPMGHLLLVGESGTGKTVLTRFVAWMNGLSIFQIKANNKYNLEQFDEDLRGLFRRVGVEGEKICFIFDESNALSSAFLERMNALLASGEVPGLFEGEERVALMAACRESFNQREGLVLDSEDELYRRFTKMIQRNLHVVFTMNPASSDFNNRCTTSPALFNRCVVDWFGTWSNEALTQVGFEFTRRIDVGYTEYSPPSTLPETLSLVNHVLSSQNISLNDAIVAALVSIHASAKNTVQKLGKSTGRQHYLSPRDYLDLINKFIKTEEEKRSALEDQQTHIRTGLQKLLDTQDQVGELNKELTAKNEILKAKDTEANLKLTQMVEKQNEAEQRKAVAEQLTLELANQKEEIRVRKETVEKELAEAEPALISAKQSVQNIRKAQLDEVRALTRPPNAVKLTLEMVCVMIGENSSDWTEIRKVIRKDDFIATVVNFDPLSLTPKQIKAVQETYLNNSELDYTSVDRASKACGPLYNWAGSQIKYATILKRIKPLRDEMIVLEEKSADMAVRQQEAVSMVEELESAIKTYKSEYAAAIRATEIIRSELDTVTKRVSRANALLNSLQEEKVRWAATAESFDQQMSTLIGDCLLAAAFLAYGGIFDHKIRAKLMLEWSETIEALGIPLRSELEMIPYLSKPSDQLAWASYGLPNDSLAIQNAILLERFNRFPLIIDPSGQALKFILQKFSSQKIQQTSFLDSSFMKTLASAIRFGTTLLVQDVESLDPVLNPVLNREVQRTGGRTLIRLGNEDIDFSPKFMIILWTRNPQSHFPPDLCSRVTTINFTITPASLESQVLGEILKSERPDVDKRRSDVLRLQGEQNAKMRTLQDLLLDRISAVQGAILEDDSVINTLEGIKSEAAQLHLEVNATANILEEVKTVSNTYLPLAIAISTVFFTLESLAEVSYLYQYSLQFFLEIVSGILKQSSESSLKPDVNANQRIRSIKSSFFNEISTRVLPGLIYEDKLIFLFRLTQIIHHSENSNVEIASDSEIDFLTKGSMIVEGSNTLLSKYKNALPGNLLSDIQAKQLLALGILPNFQNLHTSLTTSVSQWEKVLIDSEPEHYIPLDWLQDKVPPSDERKAFVICLIIKALRPERVLHVLELYISSVFVNYSFDWRTHCNFDLRHIVEKYSTSAAPLMLCSQRGQDASNKVDALSATMGKSLLQVAMGSSEGFGEAEKLIAQASKTGAWVLLRNVHLCPDWLNLLEKKLYGMNSHDQFRLFLTCELHDRLPPSLLRRSEVLIFESSSGIKANLLRFFMSIPKTRIEKSPVERSRLYGLLAWFNAVVQERLRYSPLGWTKKYEFTESDVLCSLDVIDQWVDEVAGSRNHINPENLPWKALRTLLAESLYGGRVDQVSDQTALEAFIETIFTPTNYSAGAVLVRDTNGQPLVSLPDSLAPAAFESWIKALPETNSPSWIELPTTAEYQLKRTNAQKTLSRLAVLQGLTEMSDEHSELVSQQHLNQLSNILNTWLKSLIKPEQLLKSYEALTKIDSVLSRCLQREIQSGIRVSQLVHDQLESLRLFTVGDCKMTNLIRDMLSCYRTGIIPTAWKQLYPIPDSASLSSWVEDLSQRLDALMKYPQLVTSPSTSYSLGKMFIPEAFIMTTRQNTASVNKWSLEDLELYLEIADATTSVLGNQSYDVSIDGLILQGASFDLSTKSLSFSDDLRFALPLCKLKWRLKGTHSSLYSTALPVYINENRKQLVCQVLVGIPSALRKTQFAQRSVALILQPPFI